MTTSAPRGTAKIYQFPRRPVPAATEHRDGVAGFDPRWQPALGVECGSGWYHAAALEEAQRDRK